LPHGGNLFQEKVPAAVFTANGFGKAAGFLQVEELGTLEAPIVLTNTLAVGTAVAAVVGWTLAQAGNEGVRSVNAVVGETNDGLLNDIRRPAVGAADVVAAIAAAAEGAVAEGCVGAGAGTVALGWKGGIGTSSRRLPAALGGWTVGALVQSNFGGVLSIDGVPVGERLGRYSYREELEAAARAGEGAAGAEGGSGAGDGGPGEGVGEGGAGRAAAAGRAGDLAGMAGDREGDAEGSRGQPGLPHDLDEVAGREGGGGMGEDRGAVGPAGDPGAAAAAGAGDGSVMIVLATDAPLSSRNLGRLARRAVLALGRVGSFMASGSGDFVVAFSTARRVRHESPEPVEAVAELRDDAVSPLFLAAVEAVEEAIYNSLTRAETTAGHGGRTVEAIPIDALRELLAGRAAPAGRERTARPRPPGRKGLPTPSD
jgi:D-aminopeptidase